MGIKSISKQLVYPVGEDVWCGRTMVLSNNDQVMPRLRTIMAYWFTPVSHSEDAEFMSSEVLQKSLAQTLPLFWPLVGRLKERENGGVDIEGGNEGVELLDVRFEASFKEELGDYQPKAAVDLLVPETEAANSISEVPLLQIQLSRFKCGKVCLTVALHHLVCDGKGVSDFVAAWANIASGKEISLTPHLDRSVLKARNPPQPSYDHIEYTTQQRSVSSSIPLMVAKLVEFSSAQIEKLKDKAGQSSDGNPFTSFEALAGHIWSCVTKAREIEQGQNVKLGFAIDGRDRFSPPLPANYFGNVTFYGLAQSTVGELVSKPASHAAGCVHDAIVRVNDQYLRSALDWVELQSSPLGIFPSFDYFCGSDMALTSWSRFPVYDVNFGWGTPEFFGIPVRAWDGLVIFLPSKQGPKSITLMVGLTQPHMANLLSDPTLLP